jgi:transcriptional regulator with PAS, ATPase and Fis domain
MSDLKTWRRQFAAEIVGESAEIVDALDTIRRVANTDCSILITGETGSGKELFARAAHRASNRRAKPFIPVNCAALPETLIEAELFGYRAGAFTGAEKTGRRGKISQADGGTLFLDEIGDMPLSLQARLLRVLDDRMVTPLGTDEARPVDFLLISASHRCLHDMVAEGGFREDLYYRLAGIELNLPALRDRSDRAELIGNLLRELGRADGGIAPAAWDLLMGHPWPGNVRQLHHVLRSAVALSDGATLALEHFPSLGGARATVLAAGTGRDEAVSTLDPELLKERQLLREQLEAQRWNVSHVAKSLGISRNTLYRRMHKLCIPVTQSD